MNSQPQNPASDNGASAWPRRASKACASCRRDKIRCDGARPCSGCVKRGYGSDQCKDGCEPCRRARVRCEDGKPCQRCRQLHIECTEESTIALPRQEVATSTISSRIVRGGSDRAKLACANCRRDNKKCDDQRPCSRCIARSEECIHVTRGPKLVKLRCEGCRADNKRCEDSRPCKFCVEGEKECIAVPRKGRGHGTRVKAACISCRHDKIRCDGVRPCSSCVRKGCECIERACKTCSRDGKGSECTHRKPGIPDAGEMVLDMSTVKQVAPSCSFAPPPPSHHQLHLQPPPMSMYSASSPPVSHHYMSHYYYPQQQQEIRPPFSGMSYIPDHRPNFYPAMDANAIDSFQTTLHMTNSA